MWLLKIKLKHDCPIGNRCEKFRVFSYSIPLGNWKEGGYSFTSERHTLEGNEEGIKGFLKDTKKDKRVTHLEISGNTLFFIGKYKGEIPTSFYTQKMFFTKPVFVDKNGFEYWEVASYERDILSDFLKSLEKQHYEHLEIQQFKKIRLDNIYFPAIAPHLTDKQKRAFELAVEKGYYDVPKRIDLKQLAKLMKVSLATYQEHLRRAEGKVLPKLKGV